MISGIDIKDWDRKPEPVKLDKLKEGEVFCLCPWYGQPGIDKTMQVIQKTTQNIIAQSVKYFDTDNVVQKYTFPLNAGLEVFLWQKPTKN